MRKKQNNSAKPEFFIDLYYLSDIIIYKESFNKSGDYVKKEHLLLIKKYCEEKNIVTNSELKQFISHFIPELNIKNISFYIFDLKKSNIIYQLQTNTYKYCGKRKNFQVTITDYLIQIWQDIIDSFPNINMCIWQTSSVYDFMNLQPFKNYIIIEVEKFAINMVYSILFKKYDNVILKSKIDNNEIMRIIDNHIIVSNLIDRAPIEKRYSFSRIGYNQFYNGHTPFPSPKVEKLLVDLFCDDPLLMFSKSSELVNIYENILKSYKVDFTKMFRYAKSRNSVEDIKRFIENKIYFSIEEGEFK